MIEQDNHDEATPLLSNPQSRREPKVQSPKRARIWQNPRHVAYWCMFVVLLISLGDQFLDSPQMRIFESVICYRYYEKADPSKIELGRDVVGPGAIGGVSELFCKAEQVQSELAMLRGWQQFFDGIPSLVLAMPFGWAADSWGRKPLVMAGLLAYALKAVWLQSVTWFWQDFDIKITWFSTLFASIGGGNAMTASLAFVVLSDVTPEAERGAVFLRVGAFNLLANLVMPPFAAYLMPYSPWIPAIGGTLLQLTSAIAFAFMPETLHFTAHDGAPKRLTVARSDTTNSLTALPPPPDPAPVQEPISLNQANQWFHNLRHAAAFLSTDWRIPALILSYLAYMLSSVSGTLILQYLSTRYSLTFAEATLVGIIRSAMIVLVLFIFLPLLSKLLVRYLQLTHQRKDLYLAQGSQIFLALGWIALGFAWNIPFAAFSMVIVSLGQGATFLVRSFLTTLLPKDRIATAYSVISVVDTVGVMLGAPILAALLKCGLKMGGAWVGLPFYFTGLACTVVVVIVFSVRIRKDEEEQSDIHENHEDDPINRE